MMGRIFIPRALALVIATTHGFEYDSDHDDVAHGNGSTHVVAVWNEDLVEIVVRKFAE